MKITVKHKDTEITIIETLDDPKRHATIKYSDENKSLQDTIIVMCEQIKKLRDSIKV